MALLVHLSARQQLRSGESRRRREIAADSQTQAECREERTGERKVTVDAGTKI